MTRMGWTSTIALPVLAMAVLLSAPHVSAAITVRDLGSLPGYSLSDAFGISPAGQIVGTSRDGESQSRPFLWDDGVMTDLGSLGGSRGTAHGISDTGLVVGESEDSTHVMHAFVWKARVMTDLGPGVAFAVNDAGQVVGCGFPTSLAPPCHAVLWQDGEMTDLGTLGGRAGSAYGINDAGQVVGSSIAADGFMHAFVWQDGVMTDLGGLPGYQFSVAWDINGHGQIVGSSYGADGVTHAVLWSAGSVRDLGNLGGRSTTAFGINDAGQIVGMSISADDRIDGFLWQDGAMTALPNGGTGNGASDINDAGQVVGGHYLYTPSATPAAPPSNIALFAAAIGLVGVTFVVHRSQRILRLRKNPDRRRVSRRMFRQ